MATKLFDEFPPVSTEQWMAVVQKDLKGADFDKKLVSATLDGIKLKPFYRAEDLPAERNGELRGYRRDTNAWADREEIREPDLAAAREHALRCLQRGADELAVPIYPIGPQIRTQEDMRQFLDGIWIEAVPIHWISGPLSPHVLAMFVNEARRRGVPLDRLQGTVDLNPILDRCVGWVDSPLDVWRDDLLSTTGFIVENLPNYGLLTLRGAFIEKAGASLAQELAFTMALLAEHLVAYRDALSQGVFQVPGAESVDSALANIVARSEIRFGIGTHYFLEIAKFRAARVLLRNVLQAFGIQQARPRIHAITTSSNKTVYDPYNNLLRATVEAVAAVMAGVDSLTMAAYDQGYHTPDEFSAHLARNTETLLRDEAHLARVTDPLGGSYTVEALTRSLCDTAWDLFRRIETEGGFVAAWQSGMIAAELDRVRAARVKQVSSRRRTIVGTTVYPNLKERRLADVQMKEPVKQVSVVPVLSRTEPGGEAGPPSVDALAGEFAHGASLDDWITDRPVPSTSLDPFRPSGPFEHLRLRVERHVATGGRRPVVLLAMLGDLTMRRARSGFCQGFFGAGGYDVREETFADAQAAAETARREQAVALVLCSSDAEYPALVKELKTDIPVIVAGYPQDTVEELQAGGVSDFVHIRMDLLETLERYHAQFGIPEIPLDRPLDPSTK